MLEYHDVAADSLEFLAGLPLGVDVERDEILERELHSLRSDEERRARAHVLVRPARDEGALLCVLAQAGDGAVLLDLQNLANLHALVRDGVAHRRRRSASEAVAGHSREGEVVLGRAELGGGLPAGPHEDSHPDGFLGRIALGGYAVAVEAHVWRKMVGVAQLFHFGARHTHVAA